MEYHPKKDMAEPVNVLGEPHVDQLLPPFNIKGDGAMVDVSDESIPQENFYCDGNISGTPRVLIGVFLSSFYPYFSFNVYFRLFFNYNEHVELNFFLARGEFEAMIICFI